MVEWDDGNSFIRQGGSSVGVKLHCDCDGEVWRSFTIPVADGNYSPIDKALVHPEVGS